MPSFTLTVTAAESTRAMAAVGKLMNLYDLAVPPQPRAATPEEVRQFIISDLKKLVTQVEREAQYRTTVDSIVVAPFTPS